MGTPDGHTRPNGCPLFRKNRRTCKIPPIVPHETPDTPDRTQTHPETVRTSYRLTVNTARRERIQDCPLTASGLTGLNGLTGHYQDTTANKAGKKSLHHIPFGGGFPALLHPICRSTVIS